MLEHPEGCWDLESNTLTVIGQSAGNYNKNIMMKIKSNNAVIFSLKNNQTCGAYQCFIHMINPKIQLQKKPAFFLKPGELLPDEIKDALTKAGAAKGGHAKYVRDIEHIFGLVPLKSITDTHKSFLAGFFEGEGSVNVSAKKLLHAQYGIMIDPEFSITQHVNGVGQLQAYLYLFGTGKIRYKCGSNATLVYIMDNRQSLEEKFIPFWEKYVKPWSTPSKIEILAIFATILDLMKVGGHRDRNIFCNQILPLWDKMRMQKGQVNQSFPSLEAAQDYVRKYNA
jgi:hypothetical protein